MKCVIVLLLLAAGNLAAVEVSGKWEGFLRPSTGNAVPVFLTLRDQGGAISGLVAFDTDERQMPIEKVQLQGDRLTFQGLDRINHVVTFELSVTVRSMVGEAKADGQILKASLFPAKRVSPYQVGPAISAPVLLHKMDPEYSEEARQAKYQGTVLLYVEVTPEGTATNIRVLRGLGLGLDEKAKEAVAKWQFKPGMKNGQPVTVQAQIEVNFRLPQ